MVKLDKIHFLIHGFCYAGITSGMAADDRSWTRLRPYLERENGVAARWHERMDSFGPNDALIIIPWPHGEAVAEFNSVATKVLGERCFILDHPGPEAAEFWTADDSGLREALHKEFRDAYLGQQFGCNREELDTTLHCVACVRQLQSLLWERGYRIDGSTAAAGWGASFEGCVLKYTVTLRRILHLVHPIDIDFSLTVPDATFLLDAVGSESVELANDLRLFLFETSRGAIALFTTSIHSLADRPLWVSLPRELSEAVVKSKQGIRLWPQPESYDLAADPQYAEPHQVLVRRVEGCPCVPVTSGFVYRLAKAPAYIFAPPGASYPHFRELLLEDPVFEGFEKL